MKNLYPIILSIVCLAGLVGLGYLTALDNAPLETSTGKFVRREYYSAYEQGVKAKRTNLPTTANPFIGGHPWMAQTWLDGWLDAK